MKQLPLEETIPSSKKGRHQQTGKRQLPGPPQLIKYQVALKDISRRLDRLAKHDLPDKGILDLLEDTRTQVLSLHLARQQLRKTPKNRPGKRGRHSK